MSYQHYSFDLWQTLIRSNPDFKKERAVYFHEHFNREHKTVEEIQSIIRDIDIMCNHANEVVGRNIDALEMYVMVLYKLGYDMPTIQYIDIQSIYLTLESLFEICRPIPYDSDTIPSILKLKKKGCTISVLSNTAFIRGSSLRRYLDSSKFKGLFDFQIYSDEAGLSKPNPTLYLTMLNTVYQIRRTNPIIQRDIIHVGDNYFSDIQGARTAGIRGFQINSNSVSIKNIP